MRRTACAACSLLTRIGPSESVARPLTLYMTHDIYSQ